MGHPEHPLSPASSDPSVTESPAPGRPMGELARSHARWTVYLEARPHTGMRAYRGGEGVEGRLHFVDGSRRRSTGWIFLEWSEQEVLHRFNAFSPMELWRMVESLD